MGRATRAVYPGTFDPVTNGHLDVIRRALVLFDELIVGVAVNPEKRPLFPVEERVAMLRQATRRWAPAVRVEPFDRLVVAFARGHRARVILRGLRMLSDFEYEFQMALTNRRLSDAVETMFLMPSEAHAYVSARLIKEAAVLGADLSAFVPSFVESALRKKLRAKKKGTGS